MELYDIRDAIQNQIGINVIEISSNKVNKFNQSVRLDIDVKDKEIALSPNTWFKGIIVKPFKTKLRRDTQRIYRNHNNYTDHNKYNDYNFNNNDYYNTYNNG